MNNDQSLVIINYGMGNLRSVFNKFSRMGINCTISSDKKDIEKADKLILPGVGHFKSGMQNLKQLDLIGLLNKRVIEDKIPILGICLGTQLFAEHSEEGNCPGLAWIDADVIQFRVSDQIKYKVPHMGWNDVKVINPNQLDGPVDQVSVKSLSLSELYNDQFYFVHSYHLKCNDPSDIWMMTTYEYEFVSAIHRNNIYGTQFHPEKSHDAGYELLKRFTEVKRLL